MPSSTVAASRPSRWPGCLSSRAPRLNCTSRPPPPAAVELVAGGERAQRGVASGPTEGPHRPIDGATRTGGKEGGRSQAELLSFRAPRPRYVTRAGKRQRRAALAAGGPESDDGVGRTLKQTSRCQVDRFGDKIENSNTTR